MTKKSSAANKESDDGVVFGTTNQIPKSKRPQAATLHQKGFVAKKGLFLTFETEHFDNTAAGNSSKYPSGTLNAFFRDIFDNEVFIFVSFFMCLTFEIKKGLIGLQFFFNFFLSDVIRCFQCSNGSS